MNRKAFLNLAMGAGAAGFMGSMFYPVLRFLLPAEQTEAEPDILKVGSVADFADGFSKILKFGRSPVIVIRDLKGGFHALNATCTHLDCIVQYKKDEDLILCACHNGKYDLSGKNISGPPPRPLERYEVKVQGTDVLVFRKPA
ncbi:MAG: Rieske 2Fe-2S domain-containing protein [Elusimicrobia bacterium]|nr:Rieske 2Fe-2S domain-containing protein [Elusimicrobiota bacterium]